MLVFIDELGYMLGQDTSDDDDDDDECDNDEDVLKHENLEMIVRRSNNDDQCFSFNNDANSGTICIPQTDDNDDDCLTFVSSHLLLDNTRSNLFPTEVKDRNTSEPLLSNNLISLTINNKTQSIDIPDDDESRIRVTFFHPKTNVS